MDKTIRFQVIGMTCGGCARAVTQAIESVTGVLEKHLIPGGRFEIRLDESKTDAAAVAAAIERAGFRPVLEEEP